MRLFILTVCLIATLIVSTHSAAGQEKPSGKFLIEDPTHSAKLQPNETPQQVLNLAPPEIAPTRLGNKRGEMHLLDNSKDVIPKQVNWPSDRFVHQKPIIESSLLKASHPKSKRFYWSEAMRNLMRGTLIPFKIIRGKHRKLTLSEAN